MCSLGIFYHIFLHFCQICSNSSRCILPSQKCLMDSDCHQGKGGEEKNLFCHQNFCVEMKCSSEEECPENSMCDEKSGKCKSNSYIFSFSVFFLNQNVRLLLSIPGLACKVHEDCTSPNEKCQHKKCVLRTGKEGKKHFNPALASCQWLACPLPVVEAVFTPNSLGCWLYPNTK